MRRTALVFVLALGACGSPEARTPAPIPTGTTPAPAPPPPAHPPARIEDSKHVALGVPKDADDSDDYLMDKGEFVLSYSARLNAPSWVAWRLEKADLGSVSRSPGFHADATLPRAFYAVQDEDYTRSGYDRGHMCPSADRTRTKESNLATFVLTNAHPQLHELNAGPWEDLEKHAREIVRSGKDLFVVAGGLFDAAPKRIGHATDPGRRVAVPRASFKVIVVVDRGGGLANVEASTPTIAVIMPNEPAVAGHAWTEYAVTIRDVERESGYDFDARVPRAIQDAIEARR
jgi:endonuclease G